MLSDVVERIWTVEVAEVDRDRELGFDSWAVLEMAREGYAAELVEHLAESSSFFSSN